MSAIVTVTVNPSLDKSSSVSRVISERKLRCEPPQVEPGGGGINVTRALTALGQHSIALWLKGGHTGERLATLLSKQGVPQHGYEIVDDNRENLVIYEKESRGQFRFGMPGPTVTHLEMEQLVQGVATLYPEPEYLVLSGSLPPGAPDDFYRTLARAAPPETKVVLDASGEALRHGLDAGVFMAKPNLRELGMLVSERLESDRDIEHAAKGLVDSGKAEMVLVSLGAGGAMLVSRNGTALVRSPTVPIRSKVGAGDCMVAGAVLGLRRHGTFYDAARFGVAAGAAAVMTEGSRLCRREDVDRLFGTLRSDYPSVIPAPPS